jgi:hypothetical protein
VLCALSGVLAGCGGGRASNAAPRAPTHATASTPRGVSRRPTKAEALAFARAVNLRAADLPGAAVSHRKDRSDTARTRREFDRCERLARHGRKLVDLGSPEFARGEELEKEEIASGVTIVASGRAAAREVALFASRAVRECIVRALSRRFASLIVHGASFEHFRASLLPVRASGAAATIGVRFSTALRIPISEVSVPLYVDLLAFARGPAEVALIAASATQPVPATTEHQLLSLLLSRADAHAL